MKINIDHSKCIKCGLCVNIAENNFQFGENKIDIINEDKIEVEKVREAKDNCPVNAISITE
jgi:ferredoxin